MEKTSPKKYINIYTEANPNPNSLKFVVNFLLVPEGTTFEFATPESTTNAPLAAALFNFPYVKRVFIAANFITVTKDESVEWTEIAAPIRIFIQDFLEQEKPIITHQYLEELPPIDEPEIVTKIKNLLEEYVRPAVESDGGAINFHSYQDGIVKVQLQGACSGCPSSTVTLKAGIENLLKRMLPEIKEVVAENA